MARTLKQTKKLNRPQSPAGDDGQVRAPLMMTSMLNSLIWMDRCLQQNLVKRGWDRLSRPESQVMLLVSSGVHRPIDIARALGASRQAINQTLKLLVQRDLLELVPDPEDGRCKIVQFTDTDGGMRREALDVIDQIEIELAERLGKHSFELTKQTIGRDWGEVPIFPVK